MAHSLEVKREAVRRLKIGCPVSDIATVLKIPKNTIYRWMEEDWFKKMMDTSSVEVTESKNENVESLSVVKDIEKVLQQHYEIHHKFTEWSLKIAERLQELDEGGDLSLKSLNLISQVVSRHIQGEREAIGAQYVNINIAIGEVIRAGYIISEPDYDKDSEIKSE